MVKRAVARSVHKSLEMLKVVVEGESFALQTLVEDRGEHQRALLLDPFSLLSWV